MINIILKSWQHNCGDGCCYDYGVDVSLNGEELDCDGTDVQSTLEAVLKELKIKAEITEDYD